MAEKKERDRSPVEESFDRQGNGENEEASNGDGSEAATPTKGDLTWRAYLKIAATVLLTLILFALLLRACAGVSGSDPISGEPTTQQEEPPPPTEGEPPPPAEEEQAPEGEEEGQQSEGQ